MNLTFTPPDRTDAIELAQEMRDHDVAECAAALGYVPNPEEILEWCDGCVESFAVRDEDGRLICIFGVRRSEDPSGYGIPWLLGTAMLDVRMISLCKLARGYIDRWIGEFGALQNMTDKRNRRIIMWLRWLGFRMQDQYIVNGHAFIRFSRTRACASPSPQ